MQGSVVLFAAVFAVAVIVFGGLMYHSLQSLEPQAVPQEVLLGKQVWQEKACVECHTVLGHGGYFGPDLTEVWQRRGEEGLASFFRDPPVLPTAAHKRHTGLSSEEARAVIRYLAFLAAIKRTEQWPPQPLFSGQEGR